MSTLSFAACARCGSTCRSLSLKVSFAGSSRRIPSFPGGPLSNLPTKPEPQTRLKDVDYLLSVVIFLNTFTF